MSFQDLGKTSVAQLRETLGLPSTDGVRPSGKSQPDLLNFQLRLRHSGRQIEFPVDDSCREAAL
jgi:hypothetical protein